MENPRAVGCIKLSRLETYRARQGLYRIIYDIRDDVLVINVVKIAHRSTVYKNT
ncbi:type II toxin-antitoxin system RelE/ParE family toxin [Marinomonas agarivorans]|nr:type II toxin-antitoxin system RelE/ParE family toxin [Marinomonas agarivorans]